ncbi:MAG: DUF799 domain-containing protein [Rhodoferax sp.]
MSAIQRLAAAFALGAAALLAGCASTPPFDYTAFKESRPRSILVLPPVNKTPEVAASNSVLSHTTRPLAEAGYYVFPVTLVAETFRENGLTQPSDIHETAPAKLAQIFGADAALYITIEKYGTVYTVIDSATVVSAQAQLVDLKTGKPLWKGSAFANSNESNGQQQGGLVGALITAIVKQVVASTTDQAHAIAGMATNRLLTAGQPNGMLYGPRSPNYRKE